MELRKWTPADAADVARYANNPRIAQNLRNVFPHPYTLQDAEWFVGHCATLDETRELNRAIVCDGHAVGCITLVFGEDVYAQSAEIGYWLAEEYWGRGIVPAAVQQMCRIAFEERGMERVHAEVFAPNRASRRVLEKCGFVCEGVLKNSVYKNGQLMDSVMMAKTK